MLLNTENKYGNISKFFHWVLAVLIIFMLTYGYFMGDFPQQYRGAAYSFHKALGVTILFLMLLRAMWAFFNIKPLLPFGAKTWERVAEHAVHYSLYITLIAMPTVGWIGSVAAGRAPVFFGYRLNLPIAPNKDLSHLCFTLHKNLAIAIIGLLIVHVTAALFHHYVRRDIVLKRMLA